MHSNEKGKVIRIPDVDVELYPHEILITQTRIFQRLFYIKQLGLSYLVYPGATHSRGLHSIQCVFEAQRIIDALIKNHRKYKDEDLYKERNNLVEEIEDIRLAALLHDIGHFPFSHTLEDENEVLDKHDKKMRLDNCFSMLQNEIGDSAISDRIERVKLILLKLSEKVDLDWKSDLVGNTICADLLAYIDTDPVWAGIVKRPGSYRVYDYFFIKEDRLCIKLTKQGVIRQDVVSSVIDLLDMRYALTERIIYHHAKCVASAMLARAARLCNLENESHDKLLNYGDEGLLRLIEEKLEKENGESNRLIEGIRSRKLYKRIYKLPKLSLSPHDDYTEIAEDKFCNKWRNRKKVEELLCKIEEHFHLFRGAIVLWCPEFDAMKKLVNLNVIWDDRRSGESSPTKLRDFEYSKEIQQRVKSIESMYDNLWTFWIALHKDCYRHAAEIVDYLSEKECLGVNCDEYFFDAHLMVNEDFRNQWDFLKKVNEIYASKSPEIVERLRETAASDGGIPHDSATIQKTISDTFSGKKNPTKSPDGKKAIKESEDLLSELNNIDKQS